MSNSVHILYLQDAQLFQSKSGLIMRIALEDNITEVVIDADSFSTTDGTGKSFTLTEIVELGKAVWERLRQRAEHSKKVSA